MSSSRREQSTFTSPPPQAIPSLAEPAVPARHNSFSSPSLSSHHHPSSLSSLSSNSDEDVVTPPTSLPQPINRYIQRPKLGRRKSSGSMIIPSNSPQVERLYERYESDDARTMSPRRTSEEIEKMGNEARQAMIDQAKALQASLLDIVDRVESIKTEHEKLEGGNRFLQSYIGELMQTSKITSAGAPKPKGKGRAAK